MTIEAVVALKTLSQSKRRLSAVLNDEQRSDLVEAMAQDVLSCLMRHPEIDAVHVVCGEGWTRDVFPEGPLVVWQEAKAMTTVSLPRTKWWPRGQGQSDCSSSTLTYRFWVKRISLL